MLQDSPFAGYSVLPTIQPLNLATRLILLLEDCETDLVTHGSSVLSKREEVVALVADGLTNRQISEQ
jgi:DNA-binding NarL/FixJ family response regulator